MNTLQIVLYSALFTFLTSFGFDAFGSEVHIPSQIAGMVFAAGMLALNAIYDRKRELRERELIKEEYERRFGHSSRGSSRPYIIYEEEPKESGPE